MSANNDVMAFTPETDLSRSLGDSGHRWSKTHTISIDDGNRAINVSDIADKEAVVAAIELINAKADKTELAGEEEARQQEDLVLSDRISAEAVARQQEILNAVAEEAADRQTQIANLNPVRYDDEGNVPFVAGTKLQVSIPQPDDPTTGDPAPPVVRGLLDTDNAGNFIIGHPDSEINMQASLRPTVAIGSADPDGIVLMSDMANHVTESELSEAIAYKADLVNGVVPIDQLPPGITPKLWSVADSADLTTLADAAVNDNAFITGGDDADHIFKLVALPPSTESNWKDITSTGTDAVLSVNGMEGAVTIDLQNLPGVQSALDDKAEASDLANYALLSGATFSGPVHVPTAATTVNDTTAASTQFVNTRLGNYLPLAGGTITGTLNVPTAAAGTNTTQAASTAFVQAAVATTGSVKAWAITGKSGTLYASSNIASVTVAGASYRYTFINPPPNTYYAILVTTNYINSSETSPEWSAAEGHPTITGYRTRTQFYAGPMNGAGPVTGAHAVLVMW